MWTTLLQTIQFGYEMTCRLTSGLVHFALSIFRRPALPPPPPKIPPSVIPDNPKDIRLQIDMEELEDSPQGISVNSTPKPEVVQLGAVEDKRRVELLETTPDYTTTTTYTPKRSKVTLDPKPPQMSKQQEKRLKSKELKKLQTENVVDNRPNYFVAFRVSDRQITDRIARVQENMQRKKVTSLTTCDSGQVFRDTLIPIQKLHFTLHVMQLNSDDQIRVASEALQTVYNKVKQDFEANPLNLRIKGLGHFRNSVIFAKIEGDSEVLRVEGLSSLIKEEYESQGIATDSKSFKPHMTIAKMSKSKKLHKKKVRSFPKELWAEDEHSDFGEQRVEGLELLSMTETDPQTKYYKCLATFKFDLDPVNL